MFFPLACVIKLEMLWKGHVFKVPNRITLNELRLFGCSLDSGGWFGQFTTASSANSWPSNLWAVIRDTRKPVPPNLNPLVEKWDGDRCALCAVSLVPLFAAVLTGFNDRGQNSVRSPLMMGMVACMWLCTQVNSKISRILKGKDLTSRLWERGCMSNAGTYVKSGRKERAKENSCPLFYPFHNLLNLHLDFPLL